MPASLFLEVLLGCSFSEEGCSIGIWPRTHQRQSWRCWLCLGGTLVEYWSEPMLFCFACRFRGPKESNESVRSKNFDHRLYLSAYCAHFYQRIRSHPPAVSHYQRRRLRPKHSDHLFSGGQPRWPKVCRQEGDPDRRTGPGRRLL